MNNFIDIHTHNQTSNKHALNNIIANKYYKLDENKFYSIGIHPWYLDEDSTLELQIKTMTTELEKNTNILAIGECGLDKLINQPLEKQKTIFTIQIELSEILKKPLIIHCVKYWQEIINIHKKIDPKMPWIVHGFRGKPQLAKDLLKSNIYFSIGEHFNEETLRIIPLDCLFLETDESPIDIQCIYEKAANTLNISLDTLRQQIIQNAQNVGLNALT